MCVCAIIRIIAKSQRSAVTLLWLTAAITSHKTSRLTNGIRRTLKSTAAI